MLTSSEVDSKLISAGFQALSEPLRLQILELLQEQELCVCELRDRVAVSQSKLSFHLKILREANLARSRQEGRWVYYSLNLPQLFVLEHYLNQLRENAAMRPANKCFDLPS
jgi:ArsR family transcriptional regulator